MLDPKILRENPDIIRKMLKDRAINFSLDDLIRLDKERRELIIKTDELRKKKNDIALEIAQKKKSGHDTTNLIEQMRQVSETLSGLETVQTRTESEYTKLALTLPNLIHESVPIGKDETANKELRKWGKIPQFDFKIKDHIDISQNLDLIDLERAAKVAGARFYYLKNDLVKINQALIHYALDFLSEKNYVPIQTPYMINRNSMEGAIIANDFEDVIYKIEGADL